MKRLGAYLVLLALLFTGRAWAQDAEADTTALDKLDAILRESRRAAERKCDDGLEYITEDEVQQETE